MQQFKNWSKMYAGMCCVVVHVNSWILVCYVLSKHIAVHPFVNFALLSRRHSYEENKYISQKNFAIQPKCTQHKLIVYIHNIHLFIFSYMCMCVSAWMCDLKQTECTAHSTVEQLSVSVYDLNVSCKCFFLIILIRGYSIFLSWFLPSFPSSPSVCVETFISFFILVFF